MWNGIDGMTRGPWDLTLLARAVTPNRRCQLSWSPPVPTPRLVFPWVSCMLFRFAVVALVVVRVRVARRADQSVDAVTASDRWLLRTRVSGRVKEPG